MHTGNDRVFLHSCGKRPRTGCRREPSDGIPNYTDHAEYTDHTHRTDDAHNDPYNHAANTYPA